MADNPDADLPALPCPPWCTCPHGGPLDGTSHQARRDFSEGEGYVTLYMKDWGESYPEMASSNGHVVIHVTWRKSDRSVIRPLAEAEELAELATAFGREDIAALIRELAALGTGDGDTNG